MGSDAIEVEVCPARWSLGGPHNIQRYGPQRFSLKTEMAGVETAQATQHQTNPIAPRWTFRVRTH
jgi:hypothetical protein